MLPIGQKDTLHANIGSTAVRQTGLARASHLRTQCKLVSCGLNTCSNHTPRTYNTTHSISGVVGIMCCQYIDHAGTVYAATASLLLADLTLPLTQSRAH